MRIVSFTHLHKFNMFLVILSAFTNIKKRVLKFFLFFVPLCVLLSGYSYAGVWRDTFDGNELNEWERTAEHNVWNANWEVVEGILFSNIRKPHDRPKCENNVADFLHWKAHRLQLDRLTVTGKKIIYIQEGWRNMGELCLFLGKRRAVAAFAVEGYIVSPEETSKVTFSGKNDYSRGKTRAWYGDKFPFTTNHLKVAFDSGQFKVYTNGVLLTEFIDNLFTKIDVVGLLITCHFGGQWFGGSISSFSVSGSGIPDHNLAVEFRDAQLTTSWGALKRF